MKVMERLAGRQVRRITLVFAKCAMVWAVAAIVAGERPEMASVAYAKAKTVAGPAATVTMLSKVDSARLAAHVANGRPLVVLAIASRKGQNSNVAAAVMRHGGRVDYRLDVIDYLAAVLPTRAVSSFLAEPALHAVAVESLGLDEAIQTSKLSNAGPDDPHESSGVGPAKIVQTGSTADAAEAAALRLPARPLEQRYSILRDMDGEAFRQRDLRFDGRGVVIAHIEDFPDFLSPELQLAKDAEGGDIPKFADIINIPAPAVSLDPEAPRRGDKWTIRLSKPVESQGNMLTHEGKVFRLPRSGTYRLAQFELPSDSYGKYIYPHVRKAHALHERIEEGAPLLLDVLWSEHEGQLWIDCNGNGDFSDEQGVRDYRTSHQFGVFGKDDPATEIRESAAYAVQADGDYIGINLANSDHATSVAGAAAASRGKGLVDGVAPAAQLIAIKGYDTRSSSTAAYARALATAYMDPRVDVVLVEAFGPITGGYGYKDGASLLAIVQSRLVAHSRKPTLVTAGNNPWMSSIKDFTIPQNVLSVGASHSAASLFSYYGLRARYAQDLHWSGGEGPSGDGALKPDILAPANPVSVINREWEDEYSTYPGVFRLPVGYNICGGTSCATPVAAGAAALLVGAAKIHGLPHDADAIHEALRNTASFLSHVPVYKQGRGILQIDAAWQYLNVRAKSKERYDIEVSAPVHTAVSDTLPIPHKGRGLFEREGWRAGLQQERVVMLTRRSGPKQPVQFKIVWQGNGGAFTSSDSITLPLGRPVLLKIGIIADAAGVYSAVAHLTRPSLPGAAASVPVTIVVPHEFAADQAFSWNRTVTLDRPAGRHNLFFRVPEGAKALSVSIKASRSGIRLDLRPPHNFDATPQFTQLTDMAQKSEVTVEAPAPGVWEVMLYDGEDRNHFDWQAADEPHLPSTPVEVAATLLGASAVKQGQNLRVENKLGAFGGAATNAAVGGIRSLQGVLQSLQPLVHDIEVEEGQELLVAEIDRSGGDVLDADLYLFDCTRGNCVVSRLGVQRGGHERVIVERPTPGKWKAVILASGRPQGDMDLVFSDYYTHPKVGTLSTTDVLRKRESGEAWQVNLNVWRAGEPRQGYKAAGVIRITDNDLRVLERDPYSPRWSAAVPGRAAYLELKPFLLDDEAAPGAVAFSLAR